MALQNIFLTIEQLSVRWQKSKWWIYENRKNLGLKAVKFGNHYRFRLSDIEAWEESHMI